MNIIPSRFASWGVAIATALLFSGCMTTGGDYGNTGGYPSGGQYPQQPYPSQSGSQLVGTVDSLDTNGRLLLIADTGNGGAYGSGYGSGSRIEVLFDQRTQLYYQGQSYPVAGLERGDRIRIEATQSGGRWLAHSIEVLQNVRDTQGGQYGNPQYGNPQYGNPLGGAVSFVDTRARVIAFTSGGYGGATTQVRYDERTVVEYRGQQFRPENLERGDVVRIQARQWNNEWLAERIVVETSARERY